jgi:hypothetical protein
MPRVCSRLPFLILSCPQRFWRQQPFEFSDSSCSYAMMQGPSRNNARVASSSQHQDSTTFHTIRTTSDSSMEESTNNSMSLLIGLLHMTPCITSVVYNQFVPPRSCRCNHFLDHPLFCKILSQNR